MRMKHQHSHTATCTLRPCSITVLRLVRPTVLRLCCLLPCCRGLKNCAGASLSALMSVTHDREAYALAAGAMHA